MNRLSGETSPYLLQHADNPVDWWPWSEAALAQARSQDRPILLSVGYSACHWCHVMAHESFEDAQVAAVMNRLFINIKVDREERPDIDQIYQLAQQMLSRRGGGWPLTMFLTPEGVPFYGGTYFAKAPRFGMPGFADVCERVAETWRTQREGVVQQSAAVVDALQRSLAASAQKPAALTSKAVEEALFLLERSFDARHGGFGKAPKFPHPPDLQLLLREAASQRPETADRSRDSARHALLHTLRQMARGGLFDHLGGGFARYSTDERWEIPHFEKMLHDNGLLLGLYAEALALTGGEPCEPLFRQVVEDTAGWLMREMQSPQGGYYASLDADSDGEEGRFYVWSRQEVEHLLPPGQFAVVAPHYGLDEAPNFEGRHWHLRIARDLEDVAHAQALPVATARQHLDSARARLLGQRDTRTRPGRDDKLLASWNALAIAGMARAAVICRRDDWLQSAQRAMDCVQDTLWPADRLLATSRDGRAHLNAYLDDHAFLIEACLQLLQTQWRPRDLAFACRLAEALLEHFQAEDGGFWFTRDDHEQLIVLSRSGHDGAMPSGNGVAAQALTRLGHLVGEPRYLDAARRTLAYFSPAIVTHPGGFSSLLLAQEDQLRPPTVVVLRGPARAWQQGLQAQCRPDTLVVLLPDDAGALPDALAKPVPASPQAWVCHGDACLPPVDSLEGILRAIGSAARAV
ncbi:thioredoxin domain-containing protein [Uliginosibacterium sp. H1]|uniref:thioredoxin domain-containing protein n=1 Tax=Uliginosibacterium sp. H1 TaxID=3114757 RepID=UPI002E1728AF|nr:thioredoxin domain-containing protein [Uliginosibacterium sp. H1]